MAYFRTGGGMSETTLWTNPSPTNNIGDGVALNLNQPFTNFEAFKVEYRYSVNEGTTTGYVIFQREVLDTASQGETWGLRATLGIYTGSASIVRFLYTESGVDNVIKITAGRRVKQTSADLNSHIIPTKIIGLK